MSFNFLGSSEKRIFLGYEDFVDILVGHHKNELFLFIYAVGGHFYAF